MDNIPKPPAVGQWFMKVSTTTTTMEEVFIANFDPTVPPPNYQQLEPPGSTATARQENLAGGQVQHAEEVVKISVRAAPEVTPSYSMTADRTPAPLQFLPDSASEAVNLSCRNRILQPSSYAAPPVSAAVEQSFPAVAVRAPTPQQFDGSRRGLPNDEFGNHCTQPFSSSAAAPPVPAVVTQGVSVEVDSAPNSETRPSSPENYDEDCDDERRSAVTFKVQRFLDGRSIQNSVSGMNRMLILAYFRCLEPEPLFIKKKALPKLEGPTKDMEQDFMVILSSLPRKVSDKLLEFLNEAKQFFKNN